MQTIQRISKSQDTAESTIAKEEQFSRLKIKVLASIESLREGQLKGSFPPEKVRGSLGTYLGRYNYNFSFADAQLVIAAALTHVYSKDSQFSGADRGHEESNYRVDPQTGTLSFIEAKKWDSEALQTKTYRRGGEWIQERDYRNLLGHLRIFEELKETARNDKFGSKAA